MAHAYNGAMRDQEETTVFHIRGTDLAIDVLRMVEAAEASMASHGADEVHEPERLTRD